jgi:hypothetical protein
MALQDERDWDAVLQPLVANHCKHVLPGAWSQARLLLATQLCSHHSPAAREIEN